MPPSLTIFFWKSSFSARFAIALHAFRRSSCPTATPDPPGARSGPGVTSCAEEVSRQIRGRFEAWARTWDLE
eukprot:566341-Rhodomonas_salina.3